MAVKFQDYYQTLGVSKTATADEIQKAYRKLARQLHPDVNKAKDAEAKFKQLSEAYEVLHDPEKRKRYDELGQNYHEGQEFRPPPGYESTRARRPGPQSGTGGVGFDFQSDGDFSDFFNSVFSQGHGGGGGAQGPFAGGRQSRAMHRDGQNIEAQIVIPLEHAYHGATQNLTVTPGDGGPEKTITVKIPAGATDGTSIRLAGQGNPGVGQGKPGDIILKIKFEPNDRYEVDGHDLIANLKVSPWEAALGAKVPFDTLAGTITVSLPPGSQGGQKLRIKEKGLPKRGGTAGDLYARIQIVVPKPLSDREKELFEELQKESKFNPRP